MKLIAKGASFGTRGKIAAGQRAARSYTFRTLAFRA
jgi:hypothetical protein